MTSFQDILTLFRKDSVTEKDKGTRFERLMQLYLRTEPFYASRFKTVWLWEEFSYRKEFSSIYVFNLRGNQRTSGELSRKEGGKIFGLGSRTPINITLLVKKGKENKR